MGLRFKAYTAVLDSSAQELQAGIGEVVAGTEILINLNSGIWVRVSRLSPLETHTHTLQYLSSARSVSSFSSSKLPPSLPCLPI